MKIDGNAIRPGNIIEHQGRLWRAVKTQHVKPGKGGAFLQVELKDIRDGTKLNERFCSSETVERVRLDQKEYQYLFSDGEARKIGRAWCRARECQYVSHTGGPGS